VKILGYNIRFELFQDTVMSLCEKFRYIKYSSNINNKPFINGNEFCITG
jgi:hypothetical protein